MMAGCGETGDMKEGMPEVDMNKTYTPAAALPAMTPNDASKATSNSAMPSAMPPVKR